MEENGTNMCESKTKLLNIINAIQVVSSLILGILFIRDNIMISILYWVISITIFAILKGFTDMIDLLNSINSKLK